MRAAYLVAAAVLTGAAGGLLDVEPPVAQRLAIVMGSIVQAAALAVNCNRRTASWGEAVIAAAIQEETGFVQENAKTIGIASTPEAAQAFVQALVLSGRRTAMVEFIHYREAACRTLDEPPGLEVLDQTATPKAAR